MPRLLCHNICLSGPFSGKDMKEVDDYFCRNVPHLLGSQSCSLDVFLGVIVSSFDSHVWLPQLEYISTYEGAKDLV